MQKCLFMYLQYKIASERHLSENISENEMFSSHLIEHLLSKTSTYVSKIVTNVLF